MPISVRPLLIGAVALVTAALVVAIASGSSPPSPGGSPLPGDREAMKAHLRELAQQLEWPGLDDYLTVVAYTESRYNPNVVNPEGGPNAARGLFGVRPETGLVSPLSPSRPNDLLDPRIAVATAADLAWRLRSYRGDTTSVSQIDWGDIRRGWWLPGMVDDYDWSESGGVLESLTEAESATGIKVATRLAYPNGYKWPGLAWGLERLGVTP